MIARDRLRGPRAGFALPAVLWVIVGAAAVTLAGTVAARDAVATAQNRVNHVRASWRAEGCLEIARGRTALALADADRASANWRAIDTALAGSPELHDAGCTVGARAAGAAIDVNAATAEQLHRAFVAVGSGDAKADSLVDALLDWRDADDDPRPLGAEAPWYRLRHQLPPRNAPIANVGELRRIRGLAAIGGLDSVFDVESGRVPLGRAPVAVVASLPGFGDEAVAHMVELRLRGEQPADLLAFSASLSREARAGLLARYPELVARVTTDPDAWILTSTAVEGQRTVAASVEVRLVRAGTRAAIVRRRVW